MTAAGVPRGVGVVRFPGGVPGAPSPSGPYSQAVVAGGLVFAAAQGGYDPVSRELVPGGTIEQAERALLNLEAVLRAHGTSLSGAAKVSVFLADINERTEMNAVYERVVEEPRAARTVVEAGLPHRVRVLIDAVAPLPPDATVVLPPSTRIRAPGP